jgi:hypothetical protein
MPIYDSERGMVTPDEEDCDAGKPSENERRVYRNDDPQLYERLERLMLTDDSEIEVDGRTYRAAQDKDEDGIGYYILARLCTSCRIAKCLYQAVE